MGLDKGGFILSLDTELAWGMRGDAAYVEDFLATRDVIQKILQLCETYNIRITWAIVGHLFLSHCEAHGEKKHPELILPEKDWLDIDPVSDITRDPVWYGKDIIESIMDCNIKQEIGSHSFSHVIATDVGCTSACFESELHACIAEADRWGICLRSFVYPQNKVNHVEMLHRKGFQCYRGANENWYARFPGIFSKFCHVLDNYLCLPAPTVQARLTSGIWNIPGSYFYPHARGWAKYLPVSFRVRKVRRGLMSAVKKKKLFHLWFHPFNIASNQDGLLYGLEQIFREVDYLRKQGVLEQWTMGEYADNLQNITL